MTHGDTTLRFEFDGSFSLLRADGSAIAEVNKPGVGTGPATMEENTGDIVLHDDSGAETARCVDDSWSTPLNRPAGGGCLDATGPVNRTRGIPDVGS